jgi:thiol:disulfide interchange protein
MAAVVRSEALVPAPDWWKPEQQVETGVRFIPDFRAGVQKAKEENKPFFIDFYADWCVPCKQMEAEVFNDPEVARFVNDHFVPIKLDVTEGDSWNTKLKFEVFETAGIPYVPFFDASGNYLENISTDGKFGKQEFLKRARRAVEKSR